MSELPDASVDVPVVQVAGLGPAGAELLTAQTQALIDRVAHRFVRTRRHPAAEVLSDEVVSFDSVYEAAAHIEQVYDTIVEHLVRAAFEHGEVLYLVPGSPVVAERTVELLRADRRVRTEIHPALSFVDLAWARLGIDPLTVGAAVLDAYGVPGVLEGSWGSALVAQCDTPGVLSEIKLAVGDADPDARVVVLQRLGLLDERIIELAWAELDHTIEPDHLTSVWIPPLAAPIGSGSAAAMARFELLVARLRAQCPWDAEQTHASLRRYLLEESYEVLDALDALDPGTDTGFDELAEELGDLLYQIAFHARLASEVDRFDLAAVIEGIDSKLRVRHPHVFEGVELSEDFEQVWERSKMAEKGRTSVFDGIPRALPALVYALEVQRKAASLGELSEDVPAPASWDHAVTAAARGPGEQAIGDLLMAVVSKARHAGVDPELALRRVVAGYEAAVRELER